MHDSKLPPDEISEMNYIYTKKYGKNYLMFSNSSCTLSSVENGIVTTRVRLDEKMLKIRTATQRAMQYLDEWKQCETGLNGHLISRYIVNVFKKQTVNGSINYSKLSTENEKLICVLTDHVLKP